MEEVDIKAESGICTQSLGRNAQKETVCWLTNGLDQILHVQHDQWVESDACKQSRWRRCRGWAGNKARRKKATRHTLNVRTWGVMGGGRGTKHGNYGDKISSLHSGSAAYWTVWEVDTCSRFAARPLLSGIKAGACDEQLDSTCDEQLASTGRCVLNLETRQHVCRAVLLHTNRTQEYEHTCWSKTLHMQCDSHTLHGSQAHFRKCMLAKIGLVCVWLGESKYPECSIFKAGTRVRAANFECICSAGRRPVLGVDDPQVDVSEASTEEMSEGNFSLNFSFHTFVNWYIAISNYVSSISAFHFLHHLTSKSPPPALPWWLCWRLWEGAGAWKKD